MPASVCLCRWMCLCVCQQRAFFHSLVSDSMLCPTAVYADGQICLDILQNRWSPTYNVGGILASIQSLLDEPNPNSPANAEAAKLYTENKMECVPFACAPAWLPTMYLMAAQAS